MIQSAVLGAGTNDAFGALEDTRSFGSQENLEKFVAFSSLESGAHRFQGGKPICSRRVIKKTNEFSGLVNIILQKLNHKIKNGYGVSVSQIHTVSISFHKTYHNT